MAYPEFQPPLTHGPADARRGGGGGRRRRTTDRSIDDASAGDGRTDDVRASVREQ